MTTTRAMIPHRTRLAYIHPALEYETHVSPLRFDVFFDGLELGTVYTYNKVEELGRDWLAHLLDEDAMDPWPGGTVECRITKWQVQPIGTRESGVDGVLWFYCPACDCDERPRWHADYDPANPGPHLLDLTRTPPPPVYACRHEVKA